MSEKKLRFETRQIHGGYHVDHTGSRGVAIYPTAGKAPTNESEETYRIHTVVRGDTLYEIAKAYLADGSRYREIKTLNGLTSNTIYIGMKLKIPN